MRVLPNMTVLSPCDATQARLATMHAIKEVKGPVYIRFGREAVPDFTDLKQDFQVGKGQLMKNGNDIAIIATGHMVWEALQAAYTLEKEGIHARVVNMHTIKPLDEQIIHSAARETRGIITAEEHQVNGGLGSAVAEVVTRMFPVRMMFIGMNDVFGESGKPEELMQRYGMTAAHICEKTRIMLQSGPEILRNP
jgi:transketolase